MLLTKFGFSMQHNLEGKDTLNRYLLYNAGCGTCSSIAEKINEVAGEVLVVRSLSELEIQQLLKNARPDWKWEPMLMEVSADKNISVYAGINMRLRLMQTLGISKALRVASLVYDSTHPALPERRSFLKYGGSVAAGLVVLGLRPSQLNASQSIENPDTGTQATVRQLTGAELENAIVEAEGNADFSKLLTHLTNDGYSKNRGNASAVSISADNKETVTVVTMPFAGSSDNASSQIKFASSNSRSEVGAGKFDWLGGEFSRARVFEVVSGVVRHTRTFRKGEDGSIIEDPVGQSSSRSILPLDSSVHPASCSGCMKICALIWDYGCTLSQVILCGVICAAYTGPGAVLCPFICLAIYVFLCWWQENFVCSEACRMGGYCS